jgi:restriction endonuclease S subunit
MNPLLSKIETELGELDAKIAEAKTLSDLVTAVKLERRGKLLRLLQQLLLAYKNKELEQYSIAVSLDRL